MNTNSRICKYCNNEVTGEHANCPGKKNGNKQSSRPLTSLTEKGHDQTDDRQDPDCEENNWW